MLPGYCFSGAGAATYKDLFLGGPGAVDGHDYELFEWGIVLYGYSDGYGGVQDKGEGMVKQKWVLALEPGQVYVDQKSETASPDAISRGLGVAVTNDFVNVQAGTYASSVNINQSVTVLLAGSITVSSLSGVSTDKEKSPGFTAPRTLCQLMTRKGLPSITWSRRLRASATPRASRR